MQQHTRRLALFFVASMLSGVAVLVACDTDNGQQPLPGQGTSTSSSSGKPPGTSGTPGDDDDQPPPGDDDDVNPDAGTGDAGCGFAPYLRKTTNGFFCFSYADGGTDAGGKSNCFNDETCCNGGRVGTAFPSGFCAPSPAAGKSNDGQTVCANYAAQAGVTWAFPGSSTWECLGNSGCGGGTKRCCAFLKTDAGATQKVNVGPLTGDDKVPAACKAENIYQVGGTKCAATDCSADEIEICSSTDVCSGGKTCKPAETSGFRDVGYCK